MTQPTLLEISGSRGSTTRYGDLTGLRPGGLALCLSSRRRSFPFVFAAFLPGSTWLTTGRYFKRGACTYPSDSSQFRARFWPGDQTNDDKDYDQKTLASYAECAAVVAPAAAVRTM